VEIARVDASRISRVLCWLFGTGCLLATTPVLAAAEKRAILEYPVDFMLFGATLIGVAIFHRHTLRVALTGLVVITTYKLIFTGFKKGPGFDGFVWHMQHEWVILVNLLCLLVGFAILSRHFEESHIPAVLPRFLPDDWKGAFVLLIIIFVMSAFLDNIAAALIGAPWRPACSGRKCISAILPQSLRPRMQAGRAAWSGIPPPP
jgi:Na+/H+ antiporter NhaD/arsenite permease-like protein